MNANESHPTGKDSQSRHRNTLDFVKKKKNKQKNPVPFHGP